MRVLALLGGCWALAAEKHELCAEALAVESEPDPVAAAVAEGNFQRLPLQWRERFGEPELLGRGGEALVLRATIRAGRCRGQHVAFKVLATEGRQEEVGWLQRFRGQPYVVQMLGYATSEGHDIMALECLEIVAKMFFR
jgi:hypothetical protein